MNKIEKLVYDTVKNSPAIKFALRNLYQMTFDLLPKPKDCSVAPIEGKEGYFYGFHDRTPFSADESRLLAHHTTIPLRMPLEGETLGVGYFDFTSDVKIGAYHTLGQSHAWNYHKGCRLQWLDDAHIIYNSKEGQQPVALVANLQGETVRTLPMAIDTVSDDGRWATAFSYERLHVLMPGYGYDGVRDGGCLDENAPQSTGLYLADTATGQSRLLVSLARLCQSVPDGDVSSLKHFVTHTEFSPDGRYVSFLHRWIGDDYRRRYSRLGIYDLAHDRITYLPTTGMVSHYVWNQRHQIVAYCSVREGDAHVCFDVEQGSYQPVCLGRLNVDGHQSMISDQQFVTDTYPDRRRMASLYRVDAAAQSLERIAYLYSPKRFQTKDFHQHIACDLHPRMSPSRRFVCFDSVYTGQRSLCVMPLAIDN